MSSSPASLESILQALEGLKADVAGLATNLRSAEHRIARLESATYTPSPSPTLLGDFDISDHDSGHERTESSLRPGQASVTARHPYESIAEKESKSSSSSEATAKDCPEDRPCDIRTHLQPVNEGIQALALHLNQIERILTQSKKEGPTHSSPTSTSTNNPFLANKPAVAADHKLRAPPQSLQPRSVFGQVSTPRRRLLDARLNVSKSPFVKYAGETSPFSQIKSSAERSVSFGAPVSYARNF